MNFTGTNGDDIFPGTSGADNFNMIQGGVDTVSAGGGTDIVDFGATFTAADRVNGGAGEDTVILKGDYSGGLVFGAVTMRYVEKLEMTEGFSYDLTMGDGTLSAGEVMTVSAYGVGFGNTGHYLHFDGSGETSGRFNVSDSYGDDILIGSQGSDSLSMSYGGTDYLDGQGGGDVLMAENNFGAGDVIDGGSGSDIVYFRGLQAGGIALNGGNFQNIETLAISGDFGASFQVADTLLGAGQVLNIDVRGLAAGLSVLFNGSQETDGWFDFYDGASNDFFTGGGSGDLFRADKGGSDIFSGLGGDDVFGMGGALDASDTVFGGAGYDTVDLQGDYSAGVAFGADGLAAIERFVLREGFTYDLTFADMNLGAGESMLISVAGDLGAGNFVHIDASAETTASYTIYESGGNDTLLGGGGNDVVWLNQGGSDQVDAGGGSDTVVIFSADAGVDDIDGGAGTDSLSFYNAVAGAQVSLLAGTFGVGGVAGGAVTQFENVYGSAFADGIIGDAGSNFIDAGQGADTIDGGAGADTMVGGADNDTYAVDNAGDIVSELADGGRDRVNASVDHTLASNVENLTLTGLAAYGLGNDLANSINGNNHENIINGAGGDDLLLGRDGNDILAGSSGADRLYGGNNNDRLSGGNDDDQLYGDSGNDRLDGGTGTDLLTGGDGQDLFKFTTGTGSDTVADFVNGADLIDLTANAAANSFADVQAGMAQVGTDVVITLVADVLTLAGVNVAAIDATDFLF
jgi:Ca2+-binding RTX toxin-like protein